MNKMRWLYLNICNDLRGLNAEEDPDLEGFKLKSGRSQWTEYTIYCAEDGFSAYVAVPDIHKGVDCADEKPLALKASIGSAVHAIKLDQMRQGCKLYDVAPPVRPYGGAWERVPTLEASK